MDPITKDTDTYDWPTCQTPGCGRALLHDETHRYICRLCEQAANRHLAELPALFVRLNTTAALLRRVGNRGAAAGGRDTPPIPGRLEVMDLNGPGGAAARLQAIEDAWRRALGRRIGTWAGSAVEALPVHVSFLRINLERACEQYESVGQDLDDIRRLHRECTTAVSCEPRPGRVGIGTCPARDADDTVCGEPLAATTAHHRVHCPRCGARWNGLADWLVLRSAQEAAAPTLDVPYAMPLADEPTKPEPGTEQPAAEDDTLERFCVFSYSGSGWQER